jgi:hypothetical protein
METKKCKWEFTEKNGTWQTECGNSVDDDATNMQWKYCPYCGGTISMEANP